MGEKIRDHFIFWVLILLSFSIIPFFQNVNSASLGSLILQNLKRLPAMLLAAYTFNYWLTPRFYTKNLYVLFAFFALALFYLTSVLDRTINVHVYEPLFREPPFEQESLLKIATDLPFLITSYLPPLLIATFAMTFNKVVRDKRESEKRNTELERDKNLAELNALKSQLHPHFLFNTLNNLYALTLQKSDKAPETVATLSQMLDYILYQCTDRVMPLVDEIKLIENYITLERLRYGDEIKIETHLKVVNITTKIAPLLLLSIVENAFKHGASTNLEKPEVYISLNEKGQDIFFMVRNTKSPQKSTDKTGYSKGIGMKNLQMQLDLLYPDYSYEVTEENNWFSVNLRINTARTYD